MRQMALMVALGIVLIVGTASGDTVRTVMQNTGSGSTMAEQIFAGDAAPYEARELAIRGDRVDILWQRHYTDAVYTTTALCRTAGVLCAGTWLNPPKQVEVVPIAGDGTPDWTYAGTEYYVAASRDGSVIAGVDANQGTMTVTVSCWAPESSVPLWTTSINPATRGSQRTVAVSADGSTIAVLVSMQTGAAAARLYLYSPASSTPIGVFDGPAGFARNLSLGDDGRFAAFIGLATAYVVDRDEGTIRWSGNMGASSDPIAVSTDGRYLAYGWTSLRVMEWNGASYASLWNVSGGAYALGVCAFSADNSTLAVGWYKSSFDQNKIQAYEMPSSTPLWTYLYTLSGGEYQDLPSDLAVTQGGEYILVGSYGDDGGINDEVHLFDGQTGVPQLSLDTPGSMFDVDIAWDEENTGLYMTACGKTVHANQQGRGGDLYSLYWGGPTSAPLDPDTRQRLRITDLPSPFAPGDRVLFTLDRPCVVDARIVTVDGRELRLLSRASAREGTNALTWDGLDRDGRRVASGIYFLRLEGDRSSAVGRMVLIR